MKLFINISVDHRKFSTCMFNIRSYRVLQIKKIQNKHLKKNDDVEGEDEIVMMKMIMLTMKLMMMFKKR